MPTKEKKSCSKSEIKRAPYNYTKKTGTHVSVKETCIKDRGLPGKTPATKKIQYNMTPTFSIDNLAKYGYSDIVKKSASVRRKSLDDAMKAYGVLNVMRKLNLLMILNRNTNPTIASKFEADRNWIIQHHGKAHYTL